MLTRFLRTCFILCALASSTTALVAQDITLTRVHPGWRNTASFKRISEYFTGRENTSGATVLRTHPEQRAGYYFLVRASNPGALIPVQCIVRLVLPDKQQVHVHTFATELKSGDTVLNLGLTGPDWPDAIAHPVAWKVEIRAGDRLLASEKSYLWDKPVGE